jgi:GTP diphosphokinase / guanosine-3',5'-bis(diphosphate) 3'-diphosphatase
MGEPPHFVAGSELLDSAYRLARSAHHGPAREGDTDIEHPLAVAELLHENGFDEEVVAAALLHDVVEDTALDVEEIRARCGPEVARLVAEMTEDESIEDYAERKAEHRSRISRDGRAAAIYAADKLAKARVVEDPGQLSPEKLDHYRKTLEILCKRHPELPFLGPLREELDEIASGRS